MTIETARETDARWLAEVIELPGVLSYGATRGEAVSRAKALTRRVMTERVEHGEEIPELTGLMPDDL